VGVKENRTGGVRIGFTCADGGCLAEEQRDHFFTLGEKIRLHFFKGAEREKKGEEFEGG